jgi:hypothetical protein
VLDGLVDHPDIDPSSAVRKVVLPSWQRPMAS